MTQAGFIVCTVCGIEAERTGPVQRYCQACSVSQSTRYTPKRTTPRPKKTLAEDARLRGRGEALNAKTKETISWPVGNDPDLARLVRVAVPFSWGYSKNAIYSLGARRGHIFQRAESRALRTALTLLIRQAARGEPFFKGKVWLDIFVQKPNNKGDAVNVVDTVCDAVKDAIGIDDRYFSIRRLDWQITKVSPKIFIGVGQEITEEHFGCTYCGRVLPLSKISKQRSTCLDCRFKGGADVPQA